jgi:calcium-dependent protein kinase
LAALLNGKELKEIRETFAAIDSDSSGSISIAELCQAYQLAGGQVLTRDDKIDDIMKRVDFD